jgi:hypothetical protein
MLTISKGDVSIEVQERPSAIHRISFLSFGHLVSFHTTVR